MGRGRARSSLAGAAPINWTVLTSSDLTLDNDPNSLIASALSMGGTDNEYLQIPMAATSADADYGLEAEVARFSFDLGVSAHSEMVDVTTGTPKKLLVVETDWTALPSGQFAVATGIRDTTNGDGIAVGHGFPSGTNAGWIYMTKFNGSTLPHGNNFNYAIGTLHYTGIYLTAAVSDKMTNWDGQTYRQAFSSANLAANAIQGVFGVGHNGTASEGPETLSVRVRYALTDVAPTT